MGRHPLDLGFKGTRYSNFSAIQIRSGVSGMRQEKSDFAGIDRPDEFPSEDVMERAMSGSASRRTYPRGTEYILPQVVHV